MAETSARLLSLLSLLQSPREWPGPELAQRLQVTTRTVRNDVERLRRLGYPMEATRGAVGGYRLSAGAAMPPLLLKLLFTLMPKRAPALLRPLVRKVSNQALSTLFNPQLKQHMAYWEGELGKSEWFAGSEFSGADIQMSFPLEAAAARGGLEQGHPKAMAFLERIHARPAYARALEKGGPYSVGR